jgi:hypothetical protein
LVILCPAQLAALQSDNAGKQNDTVFLVAGNTGSKSSDWPVRTNIPCMEEECVPLPGQRPHYIPVSPGGVYCHDLHTAAAGTCALSLD